ncbi:MAG TPA: hypothetical protein VN737_03055 [Bryobacteraceae bacterium]|nr:hypothetical protein [Bryobacteraceae bacterium]
MTTLEMLDALEAGLLVLRTTNESLMAELRLANRQLESAPRSTHQVKRKSRRPPAKKRRSTAKKKKAAKVLELPHQPTAEQEERSLGKRRALGRSILQLRKPAAAAPAGGSENAPEERGLFQRDRPKSDETE